MTTKEEIIQTENKERRMESIEGEKETRTTRQPTKEELLQIQHLMLEHHNKKLGFGLGVNSTEIFIVEGDEVY